VASSPVRTPTTLRLPCTAASVSVARQGLKTWLSDRDASPEGVEDARIVISELVANSVRHARPLSDGSILVAWEARGDVVEVSVTDGGSDTRPRNVMAPSSAAEGRGMAIIDVLADDWWIDRTASRSTVHALLSI
jgi:serine/threonine-protein kinase RsbW